MSHQTGIKADAELLRVLALCREPDTLIRVVKICIKNEELVLVEKPAVVVQSIMPTTYRDYFTMHIPGAQEEHSPAFILLRLDERNEVGSYAWLFITYAPDTAKVRDKMLYAATRSTLKTEFGNAYIGSEYHACCLGDLSLDAYDQHLESQKGPAPLTEVEQQLRMVDEAAKQHKHHGRYQHDPSNALQHAGAATGVAFPLADDAQAAVKEFAARRKIHAQFFLDIPRETIVTRDSSQDASDLSALRRVIPSNEPSYQFFRYKYQHNGAAQTSCVFIYVMPSGVPVRQRMMYSTSKLSFLETLNAQFGLKFDKKLDIDSAAELTDEFLQHELHPPDPREHINKPTNFRKPVGPGRRAPGRSIAKS